MCALNIMERLVKDGISVNATNQADAGTMFSPPLVASSPIKQPHNSSFDPDFTTCDKLRRPRNLACSQSQEEGIEAPGGTAAIMERYCVHFTRCSLLLQNVTLSRRCGKKVKEQLRHAIAHIELVVFMCAFGKRRRSGSSCSNIQWVPFHGGCSC